MGFFSEELPLDNVEASLLSKGALDEGDLASMGDTKEALEQFREDARKELLLQQADEGKPQ